MTKEEAVIILDGFKNNPLFSDTHAQALDMAISALSAEGEYIKKTDILNELGDINMDILTDEVKEIVNGLQTYTFPDSAENKGEPNIGHWVRWYEQKETEWCIENIPHCKCSECGKEYDSHSSQFIKFCPNCGAYMRGDE